MRRLIVCVVAACVGIAATATLAPAKNGHGVMCALHAKLSARSETTGSTSTAKGHTLVQVRADGRIQFKTKILNKGGETFVAATSTRRLSARGPDRRAAVRVAGPADERTPYSAARRRNA